MTDYPDQNRDGQTGRAAGSGSDTSSVRFSDLQDKAARDFTEIKEAAKAGADKALDTTAEMAAEKKNFVADQLAGVAAALEKVGGEMKTGEHATVGRYARDLGGSARRLAEDLKNRDMREVVSMAEDFGRRQPMAFLGLAALAGLAASRFVTASASRSETGTGAARGAGVNTSANPMAGRLSPEAAGNGASASSPAPRSADSVNRSINPASPATEHRQGGLGQGSAARPSGAEATGIGGTGLGTSPDRAASSRETPTMSPSAPPSAYPPGRVAIGGSAEGQSADRPTTGQSYNSTTSNEGSNHVQQR